jgi:stage II sporulation protein AB (anti-sigma F factor)
VKQPSGLEAMNVRNYFRLEFESLPENISFARSCVGAFAAQLDCTLEEIEEIKLVVSEAVSNSIIHGYDNQPGNKIELSVYNIDYGILEIIVDYFGKGIEDIPKALEPSYSSEPSRMGLGFTFMKSFMDEMVVISKPNEGTSVRLKRSFMAKGKQAYA